MGRLARKLPAAGKISLKSLAKDLRLSPSEARKAAKIIESMALEAEKFRKLYDEMAGTPAQFDEMNRFMERSEKMRIDLEKSDRKLHDTLFLNRGGQIGYIEYLHRLQAAIRPAREKNDDGERCLSRRVVFRFPWLKYPHSKHLTVCEYKKDWADYPGGKRDPVLSKKLFRQMEAEIPEKCPVCGKPAGLGGARKAKFAEGEFSNPHAGEGVDGYCFICGECGAILTTATCSEWII